MFGFIVSWIICAVRFAVFCQLVMYWTLEKGIVVSLIWSQIVCSSFCVCFLSTFILVPILSVSIIVISGMVVGLPMVRFSPVVGSSFFPFIISVMVSFEFSFLLQSY